MSTPTIFDRLVLEVAKQIPEGKVTTYGEAAKALGDVRAARTVFMSVIRIVRQTGGPWHRFVSSDGFLGRRSLEKRRLLESEGVSIKGDRVCNLERFLVRAEEINISPILLKMRLAQKELKDRVLLKDTVDNVKFVAGVDMAYDWRGKSEVGYAACVVVDSNLAVVEIRSVRMETMFPYVPTYLAFREMPFIAASTKEAEFDVLLLDGHGIAHPEMVGEACHAGLVLNKPTIGVAKSILVGKIVDGFIMYGGKKVGHVIRKEGHSPAFVSPGHLISFETSRSLVKKFWGTYKQPMPLIKAHEVAKKLKRGDISPTIDLLRKGD
ncbi:MAG TPA: hypothetical protein EYP68_06675 [Candidatus Korarchaeota archaeon]|nr:hypothetical protein [Candidatus Korarchaeota archaeon]